MKTSTDIYPIFTNTSTYDAFMDSLSFDKNRAIDAVYDLGYITEDEVKQLKEEGYVKRNKDTIIQLAYSFDKITLCCEEFDDNDVNIIFKLSYFKITGFVVDELNNEEKLNMR